MQHPTHDFDWHGLRGYCVACGLPSDCMGAGAACVPSADDSAEACDEIVREARRYA